MPVTASSPLMAIALNSQMRIHERIEAIKRSDGNNQISSDEEARAILAIPYKQLLVTDSDGMLTTAKLSAQSYLKDHGRCLRDDLIDLYHYCTGKNNDKNLKKDLADLRNNAAEAYHYCKNQGEKLITRFSNWVSSQEPVVARK